MFPLTMNPSAPSPQPSPPMGARETEVVGFSRFSGSMRESFVGEFSPRPSPSERG
jgi:hypothetical protein